MNYSTRADQQRRARFRTASRNRAAPMHRSDAERLLVGPEFILNNRLVILLAFEPAIHMVPGFELAVLRAEALVELEKVAAMRGLPLGRPMQARALYRLLCSKHLVGSASWNVAGRIAWFREHGARNGRSGPEITLTIKRFHRDASGLLAQGMVPTALLDALMMRSA